MSLHLIESRPAARTLVLRRPGGNVVSFAMHAGLITLAVLATSTPPTFAREPRIDREKITFVAPTTPPPVHQAPSTSAAPSSAPSFAATIPPLLAPVDIPTGIPPIRDVTIGTQEIDPGRRMGSVYGSPTGLTNGPPGAPGGGSDVFNEPQVDRVVFLLPGMPVPRYPEMLRSAGIQDTVMTAFVVDASGKVETGSIQFPSSTHVAFSNAIKESLLRARYRPAEVAGHPVRQRVEQAFIFSITR